ncbi:hypothetical protein TSAR_002483 [Trichomalopsis sarcophagae]|uniref:Ima1 N-terminal domain-containing protein n=1 Tax=Trichomalopsis sarcophagae TaxID=543379 RepID=A0A232F9B0_9HYME|nr:hypothetical protein TSAR_002483 [Trichomalopsis sarcophagae]
MDFDADLLLNFVPVISASVLTIVASVTVFSKLRQVLSVFVVEVMTVMILLLSLFIFINKQEPLASQSQLLVLQWQYKSPEAVTGLVALSALPTIQWLFRSKSYDVLSLLGSFDGDYNYEIPEQHKINKKVSKHKTYCQRKDLSTNQNSLCKECNRKEELKLLKLRELENSIDVCNDKQLARFERSFEKKYPLCLQCQSIVQTVLHKQRVWLTQYKMLLYKQKPIQRIIANREKIERILRIILSILASISIYFTEAWYLPLCGILLQFIVCLAVPSGKRQSDIFPILGWACLTWVRTFSTITVLKTFKIYINNDWALANDNTYQYFIITLGTAVGLANLKFQSHKTIQNGSLTFKKLESPNRNTSSSRSPTPNTSTLLNEELNSNKEPVRKLYSPVNITDTLMTPTAVETPIPLKPNNVPQSFEGNRISPNQFSSRAPTFVPNNEYSFSKGPGSQNYSLNDSLTSLNTLSLGTHAKGSPSHSPKVFETKVYGTTSPDLFSLKQRQRSVQRRSILAPAKLRSVTQTSWVAGGYWQAGIDAPTLSRSSSQSSGIGSSGSNYGPSCEPSVHEFDQCSVASEQCYFARPESPLSARSSLTGVVKKRNNCSPRCHQMMHDTAYADALQYHIKNETQCSGHTTIVTNPAWLPVLLCGSLIFNMAVLCAILLKS